MTHETEPPKSETFETDGHVLTVGCVYNAETTRWEPTVSVRPSWKAATDLNLAAAKEDFQDNPGDAMDKARAIAKAWLAHQAPHGWSETPV